MNVEVCLYDNIREADRRRIIKLVEDSLGSKYELDELEGEEIFWIQDRILFKSVAVFAKHLKCIYPYEYLKSHIIGDVINVIHTVCTHSDYRRQGLSTAVMKKLLSGPILGDIYLEVEKDNVIAINFYKKLGFRFPSESTSDYTDENSYLMIYRV